jgi:hypothetical protein
MTKAANLSALGSNVTTAGNISSASTLTLQTNSTTAVTVDTSQNVGIGTTAPTGKLEVAAATDKNLNIDASGVGSSLRISAINDAASANVNLTIQSSNTIFSSSGTEVMRIDSAGNVGIGTTSASGTTLTVKGTTANVNTGAVSFFKYLGTAASPTESLDWPTPVLSLRGYDNFTKSSMLSFGYSNDANYQTGDGVWNFRLDGVGGATSSSSSTNLNLLGPGALVLGAGSAERMRIDSAGNVGIGTSSPAVKLHVSAGATDEVARFESLNNPYISLYDTGVRQAYFYSDSSAIRLYSENSKPLYLYSAGTQELSLGTNATERMRIDSAGNVLVAKAARATITTDNDLSFDMNAASNFKCTPTALGTLTFTNITSGQSGFVLLVNTGGYAISAAATTEVASGTLTTISTAGTYLLSYFSDGTNVFVTNSGALA